MFRTDKLNIKTASSFYVCPKAYVIRRVVKFAPSKTYIKPRSFLVPRLKSHNYEFTFLFICQIIFMYVLRLWAFLTSLFYFVIVISPVSPFHATLYPSCSDTNLTGINVRLSVITGKLRSVYLMFPYLGSFTYTSLLHI